MRDYSELLEEFKKFITNDEFAQKKWSKAVDGTATYQDANAYANYIVQKWNKTLADEYGSENLFEAESRDDYINIRKSIEKTYSETAYYTKNVQKCVNQRAGININVVEPALDEERMSNLFKKVSELAIEKPDELIKDVITEDLIDNIAKSAIVDTVQVNSRLHSEAGLHAYIIRNGGAGCCAWCNGMTGKWEYPDAPDDVWAFHRGCTCTIDYKPSKYKDFERISYKTYKDSNGKTRMNKITE